MPPKKDKKKYTKNESYFPFKIFNKRPLKEKNINDYIICAIDPALKNCAVRIEGKDKKTLFQEKFEFVKKSTDKDFSYIKIIETFKNIKDQLKVCDFIIIESQHHKNKDMLKVAQTIITTLLMMLDEKDSSPIIIEVEAKIKSSKTFMKEEGVEKLKKPELKKWSSKKGLEMLERNKDIDILNKLKKVKKLDDHGDVILYTYCWRSCFLTEEKWKNFLFIK